MKQVIVLIGAGSMVFYAYACERLGPGRGDQGCRAPARRHRAERPRTAAEMVRRIKSESGSSGRVLAGIDRRETPCGADYLIITIQIDGRHAIDLDFDIPAR